MKSKLVWVMLIVSIILGAFETYYVFGATKTELNNQSSELDNKIAKKEEEIGEVEAQLSDAMKEVQGLISQISSYEDAINELNDQISTVSSQIAETENNIAQKEKETQEKQELLNKRLVAIYESGNTSYLEMLLTSADLSDFISKYYLISEIAEYDTDLITSLKNAKAELEVAKADLETSKLSLETAKAEQVEKQEALEKMKQEKQTKVANLNSQEKALESELEAYEADKKAVQAELAAIAKREAEEAARRAAQNGSSGSIGAASSYGYIFPVQGLSKSNINNQSFPSYKGHTGTDVNINVIGKNVVAVKSGTVVISDAKIRNGNYYSFGEYVAINHHDGTITLYAHMLAGSRKVSYGDEVKQGQVIGTVGSTGNSTGPHLHFEVRLNGKIVNPIPYLP